MKKKKSMKAGSTKISDGNKKNSVKANDKSRTLKGGSVSEGATRKKTASAAKTLGPRTA